MWMKIISTYVTAPRLFTILINEQPAGRLASHPYAAAHFSALRKAYPLLGPTGTVADKAFFDWLSDAQEYSQGSCHRQHGLAIQASGSHARSIPFHRHRFVHHDLRDLRGFAQAVGWRWLNSQPDERSIQERS
jgi:hypothetical protein